MECDGREDRLSLLDRRELEAGRGGRPACADIERLIRGSRQESS
jgi:hypothetical protein